MSRRQLLNPQALLNGIDQHLSILTLVKGQVDGRPYWAYARIAPSRYLAFRAAEEQGGYQLAEYASEILAHGEGESPPPATLQEMQQKGCDPDFEADFRRLLEEAAQEL